MAKTYTVCDETVTKLVTECRRKWHAELDEAEATIACLFADAGLNSAEVPKPAVTVRGRPAIAAIRKTSAEQRTSGLADAVLTIDAQRWKDLSGPERTAVIDRQLEHLVVLRKRLSGEIKVDGAGRPKLALRPLDWELSGFAAVAGRHKGDAIEVQQFERFFKTTTGQMVFGFLGELKRGRKTA